MAGVTSLREKFNVIFSGSQKMQIGHHHGCLLVTWFTVFYVVVYKLCGNINMGFFRFNIQNRMLKLILHQFHSILRKTSIPYLEGCMKVSKS